MIIILLNQRLPPFANSNQTLTRLAEKRWQKKRSSLAPYNFICGCFCSFQEQQKLGAAIAQGTVQPHVFTWPLSKPEGHQPEFCSYSILYCCSETITKSTAKEALATARWISCFSAGKCPPPNRTCAGTNLGCLGAPSSRMPSASSPASRRRLHKCPQPCSRQNETH